MRTIDDQFTTETSFRKRLLRDVRLLIRIAKMILSYFTEGRRIRKTYRMKEARGETFWVDEEMNL